MLIWGIDLLIYMCVLLSWYFDMCAAELILWEMTGLYFPIVLLCCRRLWNVVRNGEIVCCRELWEIDRLWDIVGSCSHSPLSPSPSPFSSSDQGLDQNEKSNLNKASPTWLPSFFSFPFIFKDLPYEGNRCQMSPFGVYLCKCWSQIDRQANPRQAVETKSPVH